MKCVALPIRRTVYSKLTWNRYVVKTHLSLKRLSPKYVQPCLKVKIPSLAFFVVGLFGIFFFLFVCLFFLK